MTAASPDAVSLETFKAGMRRLAAGVTIVTTVHDGQRHGLTATAVCSLTADPPQVLVCVNRKSGAHGLIHAGGRMCVNVLGRAHRRLAGRFSGAVAAGADRFRAGRWTTLATGAPVLDDALASFDCEVIERVETATHTIFIGRVLAARARASGKPLLYESGTYAGLRALAGGKRKAARRAPSRRAA